MKPSTALPWSYQYGKAYACPNDIDAMNATGRVYPGVLLADRNEPMTAGYERDQNIRYAVHAANLYPELVEACQLALEHKADEYRGTFDSRMDNDPLVIRLRAVLAKAKGE